MPQVDVEWPSEDEDFDAKVDTSPAAKPAGKGKSAAAKVSAPDPAAEAPADESEHQDAPAAEQPDAQEPAADDHDNQPDPDPVVEQEAAQLASNVDNDPQAVSEIPVAKQNKGPMLPTFNKGVLRVVGEGVLVVLVIALGLWSWSLYNDKNNLQSQVDSLNSNPQAIVQRQTQDLIAKVGRLMQLPSGETPTVAEVSDATQARQQSSFFNKAQNGDRVLMYVKAGEAILYRPSTNKIILVAPLVFNSSTSGTSTTSGTSSSTNKSTSSTSKTGSTTPTNTGTTTSGH